MSKSRFINFVALKAAVSMEEVLNHYGLLSQLKRAGDSLSGPCPIHHGENPTEFRVSISKNCWHCFSSCSGGGGVIDFVEKMERCPPLEAAHRLVEWFKLDIDRLNGTRSIQPATPDTRRGSAPRSPAPIADSATASTASPHEAPADAGANPPLQFTLGDKIQGDCDYLKQRGINPETIAEFGIGLCNGGSLNGRIAIPIYNAQSQLVAYAGRWPGDPSKDTPKYKLPKGFKKSLEVYNLSKALKEPQETPLIIVEGFFDVMHLWQRDIRKVAALMGSSLSPAQEDLIVRSTEPNGTIVLLFDEDNAGRVGREAALVRLAYKRYVRVVLLPKEGQQPEDLTIEEIQSLLGGVT